ncbi:MAG: hypothetical protein AAGA87_16410 [Pseudomonadota bacterium]
MLDDTVACRTPAEGRNGVTPVPRWKFEAVRGAILEAVKTAGPEGLPFAKLANAVRSRLPEEDQARIGSVNWHTTCVKLELEVAGEITRRRGVVPQRLVAR